MLIFLAFNAWYTLMVHSLMVHSTTHSTLSSTWYRCLRVLQKGVRRCEWKRALFIMNFSVLNPRLKRFETFGNSIAFWPRTGAKKGFLLSKRDFDLRLRWVSWGHEVPIFSKNGMAYSSSARSAIINLVRFFSPRKDWANDFPSQSSMFDLPRFNSSDDNSGECLVMIWNQT